MKINFTASAIIVSCILTLASCEKPDCVNSNNIFNDFKPDEIEYRTEIVRLMDSDYDELSFWLNDYVENDMGEFVDVEISGTKTCAKALIRVRDWKKMEGIHKTKGQGWLGAELVGLKFTLNKDSNKRYFVYKGVEKVID